MRTWTAEPLWRTFERAGVNSASLTPYPVHGPVQVAAPSPTPEPQSDPCSEDMLDTVSNTPDAPDISASSPESFDAKVWE
jgi:hypothetical protein